MSEVFVFGDDGGNYTGTVCSNLGLRITHKEGIMKRSELVSAENPIIDIQFKEKARGFRRSPAGEMIGATLLGGIGAAIGSSISKGKEECYFTITLGDGRQFECSAFPKDYERIVRYLDKIGTKLTEDSYHKPDTDEMSALKKLQEMRDAGLVSQQEYEVKKEEILKRI